MDTKQEPWQAQKSGSCWQITFQPRETYDETLSAFLEEYFEVLSSNYHDDGTEEYVAYKDLSFNEKDFRQAAEERKIDLPPYEVTYLESQNWLKDYVIKFDPVEVEDFLIYGIHEKQAPVTDKLALKIYAATAFGSEHQTTKSCLRAISFLNRKKVPHSNILDMGCGSGILSLACAKIWPAAKITAADIDEEAVWVTRQNAVDNNLEDVVTAAAGDGYKTELVKNNAPYDIIIANILARPLIEMAPDLSGHLKSGGFCILSGFVDEQVDWVINAHKEQGLELVTMFELDNWRAAVMEKKQ